ncbi:MAG: DUF1214 domain-containing protein [Gammaproteobacteria bacterium]|nr:DUF1214 domain-containing protein [Gammaproteobacteria bacterium]
MRKLAMSLLGLFRRISLLWWKLQGKTEEDVAAHRVVSGKTWNEFCDSLKAAGASLVFPGAPRDAFSQAEGYRYLSRLTRAGLLQFVEYSDAKAPVLNRIANETVKLGSDNPDNYYQTATISGTFEYKVFGYRNTVAYLGFGTQAGNYGQGAGLPPTGFVEANDLEIGNDGYFELVLSSSPQEGNWLRMKPESGTLLIRQTFLDRSSETPAELNIERINCPESARRPEPLTPQRLEEGLRTTATLVTGATLMFSKWAQDFQKHTNALPMFDPQVSLAAGGDPNITYYHSYWQLDDDEALVIEVVPPECEYWNFQLNNHWMESLDYRYFNIHTNKHLATYQDDGSVRIVVAHSDPRLPNWIETSRHRFGTMSFRWVRAASTPQPATKVVKLDQLIQT